MIPLMTRLTLLGALLLLPACSFLKTEGWTSGESRDGVSSSLVDYLYPGGKQPPAMSQEIPKLNLPLSVGIAFVPPAGSGGGAITEATKLKLLNDVKAAFVDKDYIRHIEVIPETYLRSSKGFEGMSQVARIYGVDIMALVSYDQVSFTEDTKASVLYWTIVGAYFIDGTQNEIHTFVDTAVFDVATRKLLFRAPGTNTAEFKSTFVEIEEAVRDGRSASFAAAMTDMTGNLSLELANFEGRLKTEPELAQVNWSGNRGGGGTFGLLHLFVLIAVALSAMGRRRLVSTML